MQPARVSVRRAAGTFLLLALIANTPGCRSLHGNRQWSEPFFFIQMADPQLGMWTDNESYEKEAENFRRAIAHANRLQPAFVVVCGDLIHRPGDSEQAGELLRIAEELDETIPLHWVAGNHDIGNDPSPESLAWYRRTFGDDRYTFLYGGYRFVVLNSGVIQRPASVPQEMVEQWQWLRETLEVDQGTAGPPAVVFQHHPLFLDEPDEADGYFNIPLQRRTPVVGLFREAGVRAVFAGHYHRNKTARSGDLEMVTTGPVGKPLGKDPSGFRVVKVYDDRIEHVYHGLDDVPETVDLQETAGSK